MEYEKTDIIDICEKCDGDVIYVYEECISGCYEYTIPIKTCTKCGNKDW